MELLYSVITLGQSELIFFLTYCLCVLFFPMKPSAFIENLSKYRKSMDEIELKEKQLAAMRVDVCSTEALKKLKGQTKTKKLLKF